MRRLLVLAAVLVPGLLLAACQKSGAKSPPPPTEGQIAAMRDYCKIGSMPRDQQREALKLWGWHNGGDTELGPVWHKAVVKKDPAAIAAVRAAAVAAVGAGNCPLLDALEGR